MDNVRECEGESCLVYSCSFYIIHYIFLAFTIVVFELQLC